MQRIKKLCAYLDKCESFADVACDHGYCTRYMFENGLCKTAQVSDISENSLSKAKTLLKTYIESGACRAVCCDGLKGIDGETSQVLIAGIGGEEIVKILEYGFIPQTFVFQPMKNAEALRAYLLQNNCEITADDIFSDGRNYYFIIKGRRAGAKSEYTAAQIKYGRDCFKNPVFCEYLSAELEKKKGYLTRPMSDGSRAEIEREAAYIKGVLNGEIK